MNNSNTAEEAMRLGQQEYAYPYSQSTSAAIGAQIAVGAKLSDPPSIRDRVQEANKRLLDISSKAMFLADAVVPTTTLSGINGAGQELKDSTLSSDVDDLICTISHIQHHISRISQAILG